ncbi:MAG TPA: branched-chain amino acid ABC transporter substrate-binding protein, partial [Solirubrobacterales bacterium]|nr:branched-chain amino acid ABC transporter substrate-binding protein [Solirubrobacterales bacterium]
SIEGPVTVYVSMPQTGPRAADGEDAADGVRLALEEAGMRAGSVEVRAEFLDDARGRPWDPVAVGANARIAVQDSSAAAYIGELDSEPTRASVPITNDAGLLQVSPGAGAVDLTRPATGYPESPQRYQPSGSQSFARTVPADDVQVSAAAAWASELGFRRVAVISDGTPHQSLMEQEFTDAAEARGVEVADRAITAGAAALRGVPVYDVAAQALDRRDGGPGLRTSALLDPSRLPGQGFVGAFSNRFGREPGPYAAYGYEAMALILQSIAEAGTDASEFRDEVREGAFGAERPDSILGGYSIDSDGDTTECMIQRYRAEEPLGAPCPPS